MNDQPFTNRIRSMFDTPQRAVRWAGRRTVRRDREKSGFVTRTIRDHDLDSNLKWNEHRWGQGVGWSEIDSYGYQWGGGRRQESSQVARLADEHLRPFIEGRAPLDIVELSPGAGRFTVELIRYARHMTLVDFSEAAIEVCRERLKYYPTEIDFHTNDGRSLSMLASGSADLFACYDSMVHMHPDVIVGYIREAARIVRPGGIAWLDHSGRGERDAGHRTAMTADRAHEAAESAGFTVIDQRWRNDWDCISVLERPGP